MSNLSKLEFNALDISGNNYLPWTLDAKIHLTANNLGATIEDDNMTFVQDKAKAMIFLRHHLHEDLKILTIENPLDLWKNIKERFDHQKMVLLPTARYNWMHLSLQDYKQSVNITLLFSALPQSSNYAVKLLPMKTCLKKRSLLFMLQTYYYLSNIENVSSRNILNSSHVSWSRNKITSSYFKIINRDQSDQAHCLKQMRHITKAEGVEVEVVPHIEGVVEEREIIILGLENLRTLNKTRVNQISLIGDDLQEVTKMDPKRHFAKNVECLIIGPTHVAPQNTSLKHINICLKEKGKDTETNLVEDAPNVPAPEYHLDAADFIDNAQDN